MKQENIINLQNLYSIRLELTFINGDTSTILLSHVTDTKLTATSLITDNPDETGCLRVAGQTYQVEIKAGKFTRL